MNYSFERSERLMHSWPKFRPESDLIPKKLVEHMAKGYQFIN